MRATIGASKILTETPQMIQGWSGSELFLTQAATRAAFFAAEVPVQVRPC